MRSTLLATGAAMSLLFAVPSGAHELEEATGHLGKVTFPTSCDPKVQPAFERAVAMLHSFWYQPAEKAFRRRAREDPTCAIADWGIASILMSNPLAGPGASPHGRREGTGGDRQGRRIGAKTQRERDYIEAVAAYYEDWATGPEKARQLARAKAFEALAAHIPTTTRRRSSSRSTSRARSRRRTRPTPPTSAAAILEPQFAKYPDHPGVAHYLIHATTRRRSRRRAWRRRAATPDRTGCAARAAHAIAHLHARRRVGRVGRDQPRSAACEQDGGRPGRGVSRDRLHGLRVPAARARRGRAAHDGGGVR